MISYGSISLTVTVIDFEYPSAVAVSVTTASLPAGCVTAPPFVIMAVLLDVQLTTVPSESVVGSVIFPVILSRSSPTSNVERI
ncbi:MAG: hypothetical protein IJQ28_03480 [Clostridia bacterium]|nr:hypothetical protein [Clostridia bacterium]